MLAGLECVYARVDGFRRVAYTQGRWQPVVRDLLGRVRAAAELGVGFDEAERLLRGTARRPVVLEPAHVRARRERREWADAWALDVTHDFARERRLRRWLSFDVAPPPVNIDREVGRDGQQQG